MEKEKNLENKLSVFERLMYGAGSIGCGGAGVGLGIASYGFITEGIETLVSKYKFDRYIDGGFLLFAGTVEGAVGLACMVGTAYLLTKAVTGKKKSC